MPITCTCSKTSLPRDTDDPSFEKNQAIIERMDINITSTMDEFA